MTQAQLKEFVAMRKKEKEHLLSRLSEIEELHEDFKFSESTWNEITCKFSNRLYACDKSIADHEKWIEKPNYGDCKECKREKATKDYNGNKYYVCDPCYESLNREFDEEYR